MTLKIILNSKSKKAYKEISEYITVPSKHLSLFFNVYLKYYHVVTKVIKGGFLRKINFETNETVIVELRNNIQNKVCIKDFIFLAHKDCLNCQSLNYVLKLEKEFKDLEEKYFQLEEDYINLTNHQLLNQ